MHPLFSCWFFVLVHIFLSLVTYAANLILFSDSFGPSHHRQCTEGQSANVEWCTVVRRVAPTQDTDGGKHNEGRGQKLTTPQCDRVFALFSFEGGQPAGKPIVEMSCLRRACLISSLPGHAPTFPHGFVAVCTFCSSC